MEGLEKLEKVQKTISLLQSIGVSDANPESQRFLANFTQLLIQSCGGLDITSKCQLISEHMSKILTSFLGGALQYEEQGVCQIENAVQFCCEDKANPYPMRSIICDDAAVVGVDAMIRSNSTLEDFCRSYFMFHKMEANEPHSIFRYLPMLSFTESFIYQLDGLNEKLLQFPRDGVPISGAYFEKCDQNLGAKSVRMFINDPFRPLLAVLKRQGLLTERIAEELKHGEEYWALERKLCRALVNNKEISIEDVTSAIHLKSFDYRVLNLLLYQLKGEKL